MSGVSEGAANMLKWLRRLALTLAPLGLAAKIFIDKRRARSSPDESRLLGYLANHTSAPVPELSSRLKLLDHSACAAIGDRYSTLIKGLQALITSMPAGHSKPPQPEG